MFSLKPKYKMWHVFDQPLGTFVSFFCALWEFCTLSGTIESFFAQILVIWTWYDMNFHFYADDCQIYFSLDSVSSVTTTRIEACLQDIGTWMSLNKLKLNGDKTELLVIGSGNLSASKLSSFTAIDGSVIQPSHSARNIGVIFDNKLNMERQVSAICKSAFFHIQNISRIRKFLSVSSTKALVHAFVTCR